LQLFRGGLVPLLWSAPVLRGNQTAVVIFIGCPLEKFMAKSPEYFAFWYFICAADAR
jgi:hypothetical protein